ncbi:putative lipid II flippase FtsW [Candidatus Nitrospira allomarina]|jgi:cell division protein FtsW|uniref:Probable peptidoglycan glycosyltransferase FtsW n=1 Tax=Candidatus Nitrospira allomarina TaxID=3020900 RepID=A0AA96JXS5_9BACT|nr:putative lipid II flippase FtsW [Candidatus Nitrospira allomarina]WNM59401.1 putative lipid II flippase FtsW [Candidatus Nitrospira allomarina]
MGIPAILRRKNSHVESRAWADLFPGNQGIGSKRIDPLIVGITLALSLGGLVMVFSASGVMAENKFTNATYYLQRQIVWMLLGFGVLLVGSFIDYRQWKQWIPMVVGGCIVGLLLVLAVGPQINGARRWLALGFFSIQPTEMAKLAVVLYLAAFLSNPQRRVTDWKRGFLPPVAMVGIMCGLIVVEPDLGSTVVISLVFVGMMYLAGARVRHLSYLGGPLIMGVGALIWMSPERWERMTTFMNPFADRQGAGYQLVQSILALENGGLFGVGLGQGKQKLMFLPEGHTDFVLALVGEELGLIGTCGLLALFAILVCKGFRVAALAPDLFGRYLALGITMLLGVQALINAGVVSGLLPTKGLTLPLVSYGGSSLLVTMLALGILLSVARQGRAGP